MGRPPFCAYITVMPHPPSQLLISVRSAVEVEAALAGGADLIDIKEPRRGPLGPADPDIVADVLRAVGGRRPVSAACGELRDRVRGDNQQPFNTSVRFVKWGLARCRHGYDWMAQSAALAE